MNKLLLTLVIILIGILGGVLYWTQGGSGEPYYAVYMDTGDLYFGELHKFPRTHLTDVWLLQRSEDGQAPFRVVRFTDVFWGPEDELDLDDERIVWKTRLKSTSEVLGVIRNGGAALSAPDNRAPLGISGENNEVPISTSTQR